MLIEAVCLGLRDYVEKCGFDSVVLGLSGGIDSALCAALAVRALGPDRVRGLAMPSRYSSEGSLRDAEALAENLGIQLDIISIEPMFQKFLTALSSSFDGMAEDVTEENLQARIRGDLLMAYSNKFHALLLTTGNKSELAVGYCTLYGDMAGGIAILSDVYKTQVYQMAHWLNKNEGAVIPQASIDKPASAELRENQKDSDSLPPYDILDAILRQFVDEMKAVDEISVEGMSQETLLEVIQKVDRNEYKRRQMPPGIRVSAKAFGEGRRKPIAQGYRV